VSIADAFRFKGALPEVANCRLAMLGESCWCGTASILHCCILSALLGCDLLTRRMLLGLLPLCLLTCSLALLSAAAGVVSALGYEIIAHKSLAVQIREAPLLIAATFLVIIVATLVRSLQMSVTAPVSVVSSLATSIPMRHLVSHCHSANGKLLPAGAHLEGCAPARLHRDGWTRPWPVLRC
jgi:hypothetical protein